MTNKTYKTMRHSLILITTLLLTACASSSSSLRSFFHMHTPTQAATSFPTAPQRIALLVPLQGRLAASGKAIRNGFLATYYYARQHNNHQADIKVIDTSKGDIKTIYRTAVANGANVIVGPLTKWNVAQLVKLGKLPVPTLALNTVSHSRTENLYQFGLSPQDEAVQAADRARQRGFAKAIVIAPSGRWGQGIANAFVERWKMQGGQVVDQLAYNHKHNLNEDIKNLMKITQSESRGSEIQSLLKEEVRSVARRRQDVDVIFLVALPTRARQIKPLLRYYYAGNIPVYATSMIYQGTPQPKKNLDLDGIYFADMPWVLNTSMSNDVYSIQKRLIGLWPHAFRRHPRLYALGVDAYLLSAYGNRSSLNGATGYLIVDKNNVVHRRLTFATMYKGQTLVRN